ncbi:GntR family transcriptional regulator [Pusillimonas sp. T7-7]|nr:GntR family transcriptional regulator [Pusillimonas sp. T7-7]
MPYVYCVFDSFEFMATERKKKTNLASEVQAALQADIDNGVLLPGDALDERLTAERFGVSRTPIREAIQQLAAEGQVQIVPRQGIFVARMSITELRAMFELMAELEGACASLAARRMLDPWRTQMQEAVAACLKLAQEGDLENYGRANVDFHYALYEACCNHFLVEQVLLCRRRTQSYRRNPFQLPGRMLQSAQDHKLIAGAILAGDELGARQAMIDHIAISGKEFSEFVSTLPKEMLDSHDVAYPVPRGHMKHGI